MNLYSAGSVSETKAFARSKAVRPGVDVFGIDGDVSIVAILGFSGTASALAGSTTVVGYGAADGDFISARTTTVSAWEGVHGDASSRGQIRLFSGGDITANAVVNADDTRLLLDDSSPAQYAGASVLNRGGIVVVAGGTVSGKLETFMPDSQHLEAGGNISVYSLSSVRSKGGISARGSVFVTADNIEADIHSALGSIAVFGGGRFIGKARAELDVNVDTVRSISGTAAAGDSSALSSDTEVFDAAFESRRGGVHLTSAMSITGTAKAKQQLFLWAGDKIDGFSGIAGDAAGAVSIGDAPQLQLTSETADISVFVAGSGDVKLKAEEGSITATVLEDSSAELSAGDSVEYYGLGAIDGLAGSADRFYIFGLDSIAGLDLDVRETSGISTTGDVAGLLNGGSAIIYAGGDIATSVVTNNSVTLLAGKSILESVDSAFGSATVTSFSRGESVGTIQGAISAGGRVTAATLGGSITGKLKSHNDSVWAFAGEDITGGVDAALSAKIFAVGDVSGGKIAAGADVWAVALGDISAEVDSDKAYSVVVAGGNISSKVEARSNAVAFSMAGIVSGPVKAIEGTAVAIAMDGISGEVTGNRHALAMTTGDLTGNVTSTLGSALAVSFAGTLSANVTASESGEGHALAFGLSGVSGTVAAPRWAVVGSLGDVTESVTAGEYAIVAAGGSVSGAEVSSGKGSYVGALGSVTSSVTAAEGSVIVAALGDVSGKLAAPESVVVIALGDITAGITESQDYFLIAGGKVRPQFADPNAAGAEAYSAAAGAATAARDAIVVSGGEVTGGLQAGRDAILVTTSTSNASMTADQDVLLYAFDGVPQTPDGQLPSFNAGRDAFVVSYASAFANVNAQETAAIVAFGEIDNSTVSAGDFAAALTFGSAENVAVAGTNGTFAWSYGSMSGSIHSASGSVLASAIGDIHDADVTAGDSALVVGAGNFSGSVNATNGVAGVITLLDATGTVHGADGVLAVSDGDLNLNTTSGKDLVAWARGNINGAYSADRDAAVVAHGQYDAGLQAGNDIRFAYGGGGIQGALIAGRAIGDGDAAPPSDPTEIDDVFSHGEIMAVLEAGAGEANTGFTLNDDGKGSIGTVGAIGGISGELKSATLGRVRSGDAITANISASSPEIVEFVANLIDHVPVPELESSVRDSVLSDAANSLEQLTTLKGQIKLQLEVDDEAAKKVREDALNAAAELRATITTAATGMRETADGFVAALKDTASQMLEKSRRDAEAEFVEEAAEFRAVRDKLIEYREDRKELAAQARQASSDARQAAWTQLEQVFTPRAQEFRDAAIEYAAEDIRHWHELWEARDGKITKINEGREQAARDQYLDNLQLALDAAGFLPGVGAVPDLINAAIYIGRGQYGDAAMSFVGAIPAIGDTIKGAATAAKAVRRGKQVVNAGEAVLKQADEIAETATKIAKESADDVADTAADMKKCMEGAGNCFVPGTLVRLSPVKVAVGATAQSGQLTSLDNPDTERLVAIEDVPLGARVPEKNPRREDFDFSLPEVDQKTWRKIDFTVRRDDGVTLSAEMLRPDWWIENQRLTVGTTFPVRMEELQVNGTATVTAIGACPAIDPGEGSVVITRFHSSPVSNLLTVTLADGTSFTGTDTHPVWVVEKQDWLPLSDVHRGMNLASLQGPVAVSAIQPKQQSQEVFNLEIHGEHVYRVSVSGLLVHNSGTCPRALGDAPRTGLNSFSRASEFGIQSYSDLRKLKKGTGLQAHHLIEKRFADTLGVNPNSMRAIALTPAEHQAFTNAWRQAIPYGQGTANATREQITNAARQIYRDYPDILRALGL